jgi:DNA-directed RNA polymerase specialized sigma24 family protein
MEVQMAAGARSDEGQNSPAYAALMGVLALLVEEREQRIENDRDAIKTELVLSRVGMSSDDIAAIMGKNRDAVRKAISRARAA